MKILSRHTAETTDDPNQVGAVNEVELTINEQACKDRFDAARTNHGVTDSAAYALRGLFPRLRTPEFVRYLSEGTLRLSVGKKIVRGAALPHRRPVMTNDELTKRELL